MVRMRKDHGQDLPVPEEKVIGFADTAEAFEAVAAALERAGFADSKIVGMHGQDGIQLLGRLRETLFFGDWERAVADAGVAELEKGGYVFAVGVENRDEAMRVAKIATPAGAHTFNYFGPLVNEQLTK
jgi:hypothetical protein